MFSSHAVQFRKWIGFVAQFFSSDGGEDSVRKLFRSDDDEGSG